MEIDFGQFFIHNIWDVLNLAIHTFTTYALTHFTLAQLFKYFIQYRRYLNPSALLNRTPTSEKSNRTPVKNQGLGKKLLKIGQFVVKVELSPTQKTILEK